MATIPTDMGFELTNTEPLDPRLVREDIAARDALVTNLQAYEGMEVYVKSEKKKYKYTGTDWEEVSEGSGSNNIDDTKHTSTTTYSSKKIENTFAKCQDLIINEYITVSNPIGQLTKDTSLYGMNIVDIIKLIVQEEVQPWSDVAVLYGSLSDISSDTIEYASCGLSKDTTTSNIYISETYNNLRNEHAVFLCPTTSPVVYIEDQNGFNNTSEFDVKTVTINFPTGNSITYLMYYTTNSLSFSGEFRYKFYFKEPY